jgi:ferrous iron transport protein A
MFTNFSVTGCSLELLKPGEKGIIIFCKTQNETIRKNLISMGISTGTNITVQQQFPNFMIRCSRLSMTIDRETARSIYVRVIEN